MNRNLGRKEPNHRQQCNDTTCNLLLSFWRKNFASTIFAGGSLWLGPLFFLPLFVRNFFFKVHIFVMHKHFSRSITKKLPSSCAQTSGHDSSLHDELRHWLPVISSLNFVFGQLRRQNSPLQTAVDKMHTMESLLWATDTAKSKKKGFHPAPKMHTKIKKKNANMRSRCSPDREQEGKPSSSTSAAGFSITGAHPALCFSPPPFKVVKETWQPVLPVYTSQKQAKKAHVV